MNKLNLVRSAKSILDKQGNLNIIILQSGNVLND